MGILKIAYVHNLGSTRDNTAAGFTVVLWAIPSSIPRGYLGLGFVTAKLGTIKGVELYTSLPCKLQNGAMRDEMLVICVTAEFQDATVHGDELRNDCDFHHMLATLF